MKPRRTAPAKRSPREIDAKRNAAQRRQQRELLERYERGADYPVREHRGYKP